MSQEMNLLQRMDRLPTTHYHKLIWAICALAWFFDGYEQISPGFMLPFQTMEFHFTTVMSAAILSSAGWGLLVGTYVFSYIADRLGRRLVFQIDLLIYAIFGGLRAFATGWIDLSIYTALSSIGMAGMYAVDNAYVSEYMPPKDRGKWQSALACTATIAYMLVPLLMLVVPSFPTLAGFPLGWRIIPLIGAAPALLVFVARRSLPESVRFLLSRGKDEEATKIVEKLEASAGSAYQYKGPTIVPALARKAKADPFIFFKKPYIYFTIPLWFGWIPGFLQSTAQYFLPTIFMLGLGGAVTGLVATVLISELINVASLLGRLAAVFGLDTLGRKRVMIIFAVISGIGMAAWAYPWIHREEVPLIWIIIPAMLSTTNIAWFTASYVSATELFPVEARAMAYGFASGLGRVTNIVAPFIVAALLANLYPFFYVTAAMFFILALMCWAWIPETKKMSIEVSSKDRIFKGSGLA